jgi:hypothetical protein
MMRKPHDEDLSERDGTYGTINSFRYAGAAPFRIL